MLVEFLSSEKPWGPHVFIDPDAVSSVEHDDHDSARGKPCSFVRERSTNRYWVVVGTPAEVAQKLGMYRGPMPQTASENALLSELMQGEPQPT